VHRKWKAVLQHNGSRVLIANGQEGEPETFKDRFLMQHHARLVVEGIAIAAFVIEAKEIVAVVTARSEAALKAMTDAVAEFERLDESAAIPTIRIVPGPHLYVCGEETALIEFLESNRGEPRLKPPLPVESGLHGQPTLVQNVETLAWLPSILHHGPDWFSGGNGHGFQLVSLSGAVAKPGVYEVETGTPLIDIVTMGGGVSQGEQLQAIAVGGPSGGFLSPSKAHVSFEPGALRRAGIMMGTGAVRVLSDSDSVVDDALTAATFFRDESCGRCTPCRVGTCEVVRLWQKFADGEGDAVDLDQIQQIATVMRQTSTCGLGAVAANRVLSVIEAWPEQLEVCSAASDT
jgi:NADH:ubiquinone oxidoreductase subunit F (NADH-binding)